MSTITLKSARPAGSAGRTVALNPVLSVAARLRREWAYWQARRAMAALGEDSLHDLGIGRGEIDAVVRHGRARRAR